MDKVSLVATLTWHVPPPRSSPTLPVANTTPQKQEEVFSCVREREERDACLLGGGGWGEDGELGDCVRQNTEATERCVAEWRAVRTRAIMGS